MPVHYLEQEKMWILRSARTDYVLRVDANGRVQHHYWGPKQHVSDYGANRGGEYWYGSPKADLSTEEIAPWGRQHYAEPGLKVTFADHTRDLWLDYQGFEVQDDRHLVVSLKDRLHPLTVRLHYVVVEEFDIIERWVDVQNDGGQPVVLEQVMGAVWRMPIHPDYRLTYLTGDWGAEFQVRREHLHEGKKVLESRTGLSGHYFNPWFAVDFGDAGEEWGLVYYGAVAYSGNWKIVAERTIRQALQVAAGLNDFDFAWSLQPGEVFTSPVCLGGISMNGFGEMSRTLHRYQLKHILRNAEAPRPVMYNPWYATLFDISEARLVALADKAADLGLEIFVVDDGWFGPSTERRSKMGDWIVDPSKFPGGLNPLIEHVRARGMKFGIWVEPEDVTPDSALFAEHPEWLYHFPGRDRSHVNNTFTLNLAKEEVQEYLLRRLGALLAEHDISYLKWDMNRYFSEPGWPEAPPERQREIWVRHTQGLYRIIEELRTRHPHVWFETCASGGGRVDLGMMRHSEQFWTSDNTDGWDRLFIQEGFSYAYTPKTMMGWVAKPRGYRLGLSDERFRFHVSMMGSLGVSIDLLSCNDEEQSRIRAFIEQYKQIRSTVQDGDLYRLSSPRSPHGAAVLYVNRDRSQAALFAFRQAHMFARRMYPIRLRGLDPDALYECEQLGTVRSGASLMATGVHWNAVGDYASELFVFNRKS